MISQHEKKFYGLTTLGEKGQVVVPAEARKAMGLKKGEKLLVVGVGHDILALSKLSDIQHLISKLQSKIQKLKKIVKKVG